MKEIFEGNRASNYESFVEIWIPNYRYFMSIVPNLLSDTIDKSLLVAGCGTGNELTAFRSELSEWRITGVDPSIEMLEQARNKFSQYSNIEFVHGEVNELPSEIRFGAATLLLVLHFLKDNGFKLDLLIDISKRLNPGAPFIMLDITGDGAPFDENIKILGKLIPDTVDPEMLEIRMNRIKNELFPVSESRLKELLIEAGFEAPTRFFQSSVYMGWITFKR